MSDSRPAASLRRHFTWLLVGVISVFAAGIALSVWFSQQAERESQQYFIEQEAQQARSNLLQHLRYYRRLVDAWTHDPGLIILMGTGTIEEQQQWAISRQRLLPELFELALVDAQGTLLCDAMSPSAAPPCPSYLPREAELVAGPPLLHRDGPGMEHIDLIGPVHDPSGEVLGGVFLSVGLNQLQRVIDDAVRPAHAVTLVDATGATIVSRGTVAGPKREAWLPVADTGWSVVVHAPQEPLTPAGMRQIVAGLATVSGAALILVLGVGWLRRALLRDIGSMRHALTALADDEPVSTRAPYYVEFAPATDEIGRLGDRLHDQDAALERLSQTDPLTGLPHRGAFESRFSQALGLAERQLSVSLVLLDIDQFKGVNDRLGYGAGDRVLCALARSLQALTRRADFAARLGGDEFAVLLSDLDAAGVTAWYERLSAHFRAELRSLELDRQVGLSAGQTWLGVDAHDSLSDALARADRALHQARREGQGQMVQDAAPEAGGAE